ncbi:MAG: hypothetical protein K6G24_11215 [Lachnospiraceae bacterium]|nr:hypothetical protein [Lachnospiraceae bacterium]
MKEKINSKSVAFSLLAILVGVALIALDLTILNTKTCLWINVGCSVIGSGLVILLTAICIERIKNDPLKVWGIARIYPSRAVMNTDCEISVNNARYKIDAIGFGFRSYRDQKGKDTEKLLKRGVNIRIITMNPDSQFVHQREQEENEVSGQISNSIKQLVAWADNLNKKKYQGKIVIKGYSCMTLHFYWRVDDEMYTGPYWYGKGSQQTISYKYGTGKAFNAYSDYFESLWNNSDLMKTLTK